MHCANPVRPANDAATQTYRLPAHIYLCAFDTGSVVLDLKRNRYSAIGADAAGQLAALINSAVAGFPPTDPVVARWISKGLLEQARFFARPFEPASYPELSTLEDLKHRQATLRPRDVASFTWQCAYARRALRIHSLWKIACDLRACSEQRRSTSNVSISALAQAVQRFRRLRPLAFAERDQCLYHALALARFLCAFGLPATWMIGVRLHPWGAHSWVQHGAWILDSTPEYVHDFRPIIAV